MLNKLHVRHSPYGKPFFSGNSLSTSTINPSKIISHLNRLTTTWLFFTWTSMISMMLAMTMRLIRSSPRKQVRIRTNPFLNGLEVSVISQSELWNGRLSLSLENELQIAICNQLYFQRNPSEIFGNTMDCSPAHLRTILHSMLPNLDLFDDNRHQSTINSNKSILI